ncbi:MAG: AAA family ATPase [Ignavibacteriaceae bacterium]|nr:AAA family ATPase [Ignavibacteriaceae bacterium]
MYISKLIIRNFRNFKNVKLLFTDGINTIIGENGSGKTNLFHAIRILIDDDLPRGIKFTESDFNRAVGAWKGNWIIIQIEFSDLDPSEEAQVIAVHKIGKMDEYDSTIGTFSVVFRPKVEIRKKLFELSISESKTQAQLNEILNNIDIDDYETIFMGRGNSDFSLDENYLKYVGDYDNISFPNPDEEQSDIYGVRTNGMSIPNEVSCTFAKALRDVESDLRKYKDNPLLNLLRGHEKNIKVAEKEGIKKDIETLNNRISELNEVQEVSNGISDSIKSAVGETYAPNIKIKSELPSEMDKLLQSLRLWVSDPDENGYEGKIW